MLVACLIILLVIDVTKLSYKESLLASASSEIPDPSIMRFMWITPIYTTSILSRTVQVPQSANFIQINQKSMKLMSDFILQRYESRIDLLRDIQTTKSDAFYQIEQQQELQYKLCKQENKTGNKSEDCDPIYPFRANLISIFFDDIKRYFAETNVDYVYPNSEYDLDLAFSIWSSVHANGSFHTSHHHVSSVISGVLYLSLPDSQRDKVGDLVFSDPRGALPPFGNTLRIQPEVGSLILFPGSLLHNVEPTLSKTPRISISFNFNGDWSSLGDINQAYLVQPKQEQNLY